MKISIITIAYNSEETIEDTILSVLAQSHKDIEYIVVDGASKDSTMDIVNKHKSGISIIISEPDKGIYDAMNKGVLAATGDVIGILNSDDFYADNNVIKDVNAAFEKSDIEGLYADLVYVDRNNPTRVVRNWKSGDYRPGLFLKGWMPPHPTFFVKKSCYDRLGIYSTSLKSAADYELMLRFIHKENIKLGYLPRVITKMRLGGQSNVSLKNRIRANQEDRKAWAMNGLKPGPFTLIRKPLGKIKQYLR
jgi:glycosyltransferase involved in cell wall biosynthesis